jgi:hypothetical protein
MSQKSVGCLNHDPNLPHNKGGLGHTFIQLKSVGCIAISIIYQLLPLTVQAEYDAAEIH